MFSDTGVLWLRWRGDCDILVLTVEVGSGGRTDVVLHSDPFGGALDLIIA
jgi:hypothetical protein